MLVVPRTCTRQIENAEGDSPQPQVSVALETLRDLYAFVLLGDPGAGKSETFNAEAKALGTEAIKAHDFIAFEQKPEHWQDKTIFIDGLDETRAGGSDGRTVLDTIRHKLDQLGRPRFRLSCRAADWLGQSDSVKLKALLPNGDDFHVYRLDPLTENDIAQILTENYAIGDTAEFVQEAQKNRLTELLHNPQTLDMLANAVGGKNTWPASRIETYQFACSKLMTEPNIEHLSATHKTRPSDQALLSAAGYLSCLYLIADLQGLSQFPSDRADVLHVGTISNPDQLPLAACFNTRLFKSLGNNAFAPVHRTVAEYLAARFLTDRLEANLLLSRVLALICGSDGGVVTGMRGLHAWLAACAVTTRRKLIDIDPLGILLYGDARTFTSTEKLWILNALKRVAGFSGSVPWQDWNAQPFAAFATSDMVEELQKLLRSMSRARADQILVDCLVDALYHGDALQPLGSLLLDLARDASWWSGIRKRALQAYLKNYFNDAIPALELLDDITNDKVKDHDDELLGALLERLYPGHLSPKAAIEHLHPPKDERLIGHYTMFWRQGFLERTTDDLLVELLDAFRKEKARRSDDFRDYQELACALLVRGLETLGDCSTDEKVFEWLGICMDEDNDTSLEHEDRKRVHAWFSARPERYKGVLRISLDKLDAPGSGVWSARDRLHDAPQPPNMGAWWLLQASREPNEQLAKAYFDIAVSLVVSDAVHAGISLEDLETRAEERSGFSEVLTRALTCDLSDHEWRLKNAQRKRKNAEERKARAAQFRTILSELRNNTAPTQALYTLAGAYFGHYYDARGDRPVARLENLLDEDAELVDASLLALKNSLFRADLPTVQQILESDQKGKIFHLSLAILAGLELMYESEPAGMNSLPDDLLLQALVSRYTYGADNEPAWFEHLVQARPDLVARACIAYTQGRLRARKDYVHGTYSLVYNEAYAIVAKSAVPTLLESFPQRANLKQLSVLEDLLKAAIRYLPPQEIGTAISAKLALRNLDVGQRIYWMTAGLIVRPSLYKAKLKTYVYGKEIRVEHLGNFLYDRSGQWRHGYEFPVSSLALLTELLAPSCRPERPPEAHFVTAEMNRADLVRNFINRLAASGDVAATTGLQRLENLSGLHHWAGELRHARLAQQIVHRDASFNHPSHQEVTATLYKGVPANTADVAAIVNEVLRELEQEIQFSDLNIYRQFWNVDSYGHPVDPKPEESCRDTLAYLLRERLAHYSINCQPEAQHVGEKRSDLWCTYSFYGVPIEIKQDKHRNLWRAMNEQLVAKYSVDPRAQGHGIYLILWFGGKGMPSPDTGTKPRSAQELARRLDERISPAQHRLISVCVLDCTDRKE